MACQGFMIISFVLITGEENIFQRSKKTHKPSCKNINLHLVSVMRDSFVSFILTFRNLCKSTLAYNSLFSTSFLVLSHFPKLFLNVRLELSFSDVWRLFFFLTFHLTVKFWIPRSQWQISHQLQQGFYPGSLHLFICFFWNLFFQSHCY